MKALPDKSGYLHAKRVQETLENFMSSADDVVKMEHIPEWKGKVANVSTSSEHEELYGKHGSNHSYLNSQEYKQVS